MHSSVLVHVLEADLGGAEYHSFLEMMLTCHATFSLVWRDQLSFNESASAIRADLKRHELDYRRRDRWPGTRLSGKGQQALIVSYATALDAIPTLSTPGSLFSWRSPNFPEDLAFYTDDGDCTFTSVSHDREAYVLDNSTSLMLATLAKVYPLEVPADTVAVLTGT